MNFQNFDSNVAKNSKKLATTCQIEKIKAQLRAKILNAELLKAESLIKGYFSFRSAKNSSSKKIIKLKIMIVKLK